MMEDQRKHIYNFKNVNTHQPNVYYTGPRYMKPVINSFAIGLAGIGLLELYNTYFSTWYLIMKEMMKIGTIIGTNGAQKHMNTKQLTNYAYLPHISNYYSSCSSLYSL